MQFAVNQPDGSHVSSLRVWQHKASRFNPIKGLKPDTLTQWIDDFNRGYIRPFALAMDAIQSRDDVLKSVIPKRNLAIARREIEVVSVDDSPEAQNHKETLEYFWRNSTATDALDLNRKGGPALLIKQMMDAHAKHYAVHELLWRPTPDGLTCDFHFVPLWWFENYSGALRFLPHDLAYYGNELEDGAWMVTIGDWLMEACSVAYMYKTLSLRDWVIYNEKNASPGLMGKTKAQKGSAKWEEMKTAVMDIAADFSVVIGESDEISKIDFSADGQLPYPPLVERMDRAMSAIWRGADLSTISAGHGHGQGASLQGEESDLMEAGDALLLSETLNMQVENRVIAYAFGEGTKPLAYGRITIPPKQDVVGDIAIDKFLVEAGADMGMTDAMERYGRSLPDDGERLLKKSVVPNPFGGNGNGNGNGNTPFGINGGRPQPELNGETEPIEQANESRRLLKRTQDELLNVQSAAIGPLRERLAGILELTNETAFRAALKKLREDMPNLLVNVKRDTVAVLERGLTADAFNRCARDIVRKR